jgi:hypothetical protein
LRRRIELAPAFLTVAIDHDGSGAEANDEDPDELVELAIDLCVRCAMEIWGQGEA